MGKNNWLQSRHGDYIKNLKETWTKKSQLFLWCTSLHGPQFIHRSVLDYLYRCQDYLYLYLYYCSKKGEKQDIWGIVLRWLNPYLRHGYGSLTAMNWYLTCTELSCHLLKVGIFMERADIEVIKSSLLSEKNSIADGYGVRD